MIKPKPWKGNDLKGEWVSTYKLDGVRMLRDEDGKPVSRSGKPLYNLDHISSDITDAEIYSKNWETSVSLVRTKNGSPIPVDCVYSLDPIDPRLNPLTWTDPSANLISKMLDTAVYEALEGIVLRQGDKWLKVKPTETHDVKIIGMMEGTGKYVGMMGCLVTPMGRIGTGFTDEERKDFWERKTELVWNTVEVECMSLTKDGKFRHPRFKRIRWDK